MFPINSATGNLLINDIGDAFNLDSSVGVQQDTLAKYITINRYFGGQIFDGYFGVCKYNSDPVGDVKGLCTYSTSESYSGKTLSYSDVLASTMQNLLDDNNFRILMKLKAVLNNCNGSMKEIDEAIYSVFGSAVYATFNEKEINYTIPRNLSQLATVAITKEILPRPAGSSITYTVED